MPLPLHPLLAHAAILSQLTADPPPVATVALGPLTVSKTVYEIVTKIAAVAITVLIALILLRLVPVLERVVIRRAKQNSTTHYDESAAELRQRVETLTRVTGSIARALIWSVTVVLLMETVGVSVAPLIAGAGIAGVAVGFGAQSIVKDFFAGFFILFEHQFSVGDTVSIAGVTGTVELMTLRITMLRDTNGTAFFIPNSTITTVANKTLGWVRVMLDASFSFGVPEEKTRAALEAAAKRISALPHLKDALVEAVEVEGPIELTGGAVTYRLGAKAHVNRPAEVRQSMISGLQAELFAHGLGYEAAMIVERARTPPSPALPPG